MKTKAILVTGGTGFIGSHLVRRLIKEGHKVSVLDNGFRGKAARLNDMAGNFELNSGDIRDPAAVEKSVQGMDSVFHLASVNGTEFFYSQPEVVLDIAVKGMSNILDACVKHNIGELILASSSEVYQTPSEIPTKETVALSIPDPLNPRYSYGGGKLISELMTLHYGRKYFKRVMIFRPHNVYGPDMGWEHVVPQFVLRMKKLRDEGEGVIKFPIQGTGKETRAFVFIDDFMDGLMIMYHKGEHLNIYHIGSMEEISIENVAKAVGKFYGRQIDVVPGEPASGGTSRRCPDIAKLASLGYRPKIDFKMGLPVTAHWYDEHAQHAPVKT